MALQGRVSEERKKLSISNLWAVTIEATHLSLVLFRLDEMRPTFNCTYDVSDECHLSLEAVSIFCTVV
jgi:hypothetical protein